MKSYKKKRHPTRKGVQFSTVPPSLVSCANNEIDLLRYFKKIESSANYRFNIRSYSKVNNIARSTIYSVLSRLCKKGLITNESNKHDNNSPNWWASKITEKGTMYIETTNRGVETSRSVCRRDGGKISLHKADFIMNIKKLDWGAIEKLDTLDPLTHKKPKWKNNPQHHLHFDNMTISVFTKKVIFRVHDIISDNTGQNEYDAFLRVSEYVDKLSDLGIHGETIICEPAHYSHIDSYLAGYLKKIDGKYKLDLSDGSCLWIDYSDPNGLEDETNKKENRLRLDNFMDDVITNSDSNMSDVDSLIKDMDSMKEIASSLLKLELMKRQPIYNLQTPNERPTYFG